MYACVPSSVALVLETVMVKGGESLGACQRSGSKYIFHDVKFRTEESSSLVENVRSAYAATIEERATKAKAALASRVTGMARLGYE